MWFCYIFPELPTIFLNRVSSVPATSSFVPKEPQNKKCGFIFVFVESDNVACANFVAFSFLCVGKKVSEYFIRPVNYLVQFICHMCVSLTAFIVCTMLCSDMNEITMYVLLDRTWISCVVGMERLYDDVEHWHERCGMLYCIADDEEMFVLGVVHLPVVSTNDLVHVVIWSNVDKICS